jgi:hypothetical protein
LEGAIALWVSYGDGDRILFLSDWLWSAKLARRKSFAFGFEWFVCGVRSRFVEFCRDGDHVWGFLGMVIAFRFMGMAIAV